MSACGQERIKAPGDVVVKEHYTTVSPDESLRAAAPRPSRRPISNDRDIAELITDLYEWGDDVASKLSKTWQSIDAAKERVNKLNAETPR